MAIQSAITGLWEGTTYNDGPVTKYQTYRDNL